jgi:outer membrane protein OmpA-like peptidoglycan-associated protein
MSKTLTLGICLLSLSLAACSNDQPPPPDVPTGNNPFALSTTGKSAVIGGAAGAGIGALGGSTGAVVVGAAAGAAIGAVIGSEVEKERAVAISQHDSGVRLVRHQKSVKLIMPSDIYFASGDARIKQEYYPMLDGLVDLLQANPDTFIEVIGYTDNEGDRASNQQLGEIRAENVAAYIESQGISAGRIRSLSRGAATPQATNGTPAGRGENRRVEINLWPIPR